MTFTHSTSLSDYPFKSQIDWFLGNITASTYDQAIHEVWNRVNHNYCGLLECVRKETVQNTINSYINLVQSNSNLPIYKWYYVEKSPQNEYLNLVNMISGKAGLKVDEVKKIMKQLEFADEDGSIVKGILNPRLLDNNIKNTPENADSYDNKLGMNGLSGDVLKYIKWGAIGVGTALLLGFGIKTMNLLD